MSTPGQKPHILIESDPALARWLLEGCSDSEKPFLLTANPSSGPRGRMSGRDGARRLGLSIEELIRLTLYNEGTDGPARELLHLLELVRSHFNLAASDPVRLAMAGTHTSLSGMLYAAQIHRVDASRQSRTRQEDATRKGRTLVGLLEATFAELGYFELMWLADAFPQLRPKLVSGRYDRLAEQARDLLTDIQIPPFPQAERKLRQPALPLIFVTRDPKPAEAAGCDRSTWERLVPMDRTHPFSVTQKLIEQFERHAASEPTLRGVLVKVLPRELSNQNRLDAPLVGDSTINLADRAGLEAILLDARHGVLRQPLDDGVRAELVVAAPLAQRADP